MTKNARIYGGSLYGLAAEEGLESELMAQVSVVDKLVRDIPDYIRLLSEPSIPKKERIGLLDQAFGEQLHPYLLNFMKLLCEQGIMGELAGCCREYEIRYYEDHGIAEARVISAVPLSETQKAALKDKLEQISQKTVLLAERCDPSVLGGLKVELEGKQLDGTIQERLDSLRRLLLQPAGEMQSEQLGGKPAKERDRVR